jgi:hypothetical protein
VASVAPYACQPLFLHATPRILGHNLAWKLELTASLALMVMMLALYALVAPSHAWAAYVLFHSAIWKGFWLTFVPIGLGSGLLAHYVVVPALRRLHRRNHVYAERLRLPTQLPFPLLIIRGAADEVAGILGATQLVSHLATLVLRAALKLVPVDRDGPDTESSRGQRTRWQVLPSFIRAGLLLCAAACAPLGMLVVAKSIGIHPSAEMAHLAGAVSLLLLVVGVLVMAWESVTQLIVIPVFILLCIATIVPALLFGWRFALATFSLDISAEATPPGHWNSFQLKASSTPYENRRGLSHATHSDPVALAEMTRWLRELDNAALTRK